MVPQLKTKSTGIYFVEFEGEDGERRRVSTGTRDKAEARTKMRDIVLGFDPSTRTVQKAGKRAGHVTMQDLFDRAEKTVWAPGEAKSQATIRSNLKILGDLIGHEAIEDMTYSRLERLVGELRDGGAGKKYAPATIKRKLDMVSKALRMATIWTDDKGRPLLAAKPSMPPIRVANLKDRVVDRNEEIAIFNAIEQRRQDEPGRQWFRLAGLARFLLDTGGRLGESLRLNPDNISIRLGQAYVTFPRYQTKSDKPRTVPLTPAASTVLDEMTPHVARRSDGSLSFFPISEQTTWYMWDQVRQDVKKAGFNIDDVTLHTLRHTCLTRLAQGGMDLLRLQKWAGHSDPKITAERYTHLQPGDLLGGVAILSSDGANPPIKQEDNIRPVNAPNPKAGVNRATGGTRTIN